MKMRQWSWTARAAHEQAFARATWFTTFTFKPATRHAIFQAASALDSSVGTSTQRLIRASGSYITEYLKRLRKADFALRYIQVPELHRDGFPHWHGLIHVPEGGANWADLHGAWSGTVDDPAGYGHAVVKLVRDANALRYVTKYLSKERLGRVRSSLNYGEPTLARPLREAERGKESLERKGVQ